MRGRMFDLSYGREIGEGADGGSLDDGTFEHSDLKHNGKVTAKRTADIKRRTGGEELSIGVACEAVEKCAKLDFPR